MRNRSSSKHSNYILASLSAADFKLLGPLELVDLPLRTRLEERNKSIKKVWFFESGLASIVAHGSKKPIEVGLIGREGMSGFAVVLGNHASPHETFMQIGGSGRWVASDVLREAMRKSASLLQTVLQNCHRFLIETSYTALANGHNKVEERLARWLLMADDRTAEDGLPLTHEFLALMLGVRRPSVTEALEFLERKGLIRRARGAITLLDRPQLIAMTGGTYQPL